MAQHGIQNKKDAFGLRLDNFLKKKISRRDFIKYSFISGAGIASTIYGCRYLSTQINKAGVFPGAAPDKLWKWSREAYHYRQLGDNVQCLVCPNECLLEPDDRGICRNKVNKNGKLYTIAYGNPCSVHIDPIEKKPLYHFLPTSSVFSIATAGCSFRCLNCQNWSISQFQPEELNNIDLMPDSVVATAASNSCQSIAYTYSEPVSFYEYMLDTSKIAKEKGIKNVWVTNGYINDAPLNDLCKYIDAANVDLKSFSDSIYQKLNSGTLQPVLNTLKTLAKNNVWFEITNLIIPSWTDDIDMIKEMCEWLVKNNLEHHPLHFSRFSPMYKLTHLPPTSVSLLKNAKNIAEKAGMKYVYIGNVPGEKAQNTYCPRCNELIIERIGYKVTINNLNDGLCGRCGEYIAGVWKA